MAFDSPSRGPGLAKTRGHRLFLRRAIEVWTSIPGALAAYLRAADIISEGEVRDEGDARAYYGTTSLLLHPDARLGALSAEDLAQKLSEDPHFRLLALRVAVREASHRAGAEMGSVSADIRFQVTGRGVAVTVDLAAPLDMDTARTA